MMSSRARHRSKIFAILLFVSFASGVFLNWSFLVSEWTGIVKIEDEEDIQKAGAVFYLLDKYENNSMLLQSDVIYDAHLQECAKLEFMRLVHVVTERTLKEKPRWRRKTVHYTETLMGAETELDVFFDDWGQKVSELDRLCAEVSEKEVPIIHVYDKEEVQDLKLLDDTQKYTMKMHRDCAMEPLKRVKIKKLCSSSDTHAVCRQGLVPEEINRKMTKRCMCPLREIRKSYHELVKAMAKKYPLWNDKVVHYIREIPDALGERHFFFDFGVEITPPEQIDCSK